MDVYCLECGSIFWVESEWPTCGCGSTRFASSPGGDEQFRALAEGLPVAWAQLPADDDGEALALAYIRAAYGRGYVAALEQPERFGRRLLRTEPA